MHSRKQIQLYAVDTSAFYTDSENKIHIKLNRTYLYRKHLKMLRDKAAAKHIEDHIKYANHRIKKLKEKLSNLFKLNKQIRIIRNENFRLKNRILVFESILTRVLHLSHQEISKDIIVVQTYFFDILKDLITHGFLLYDETGRCERYVCFTASAGQIREKKTIFIKESLLNKHRSTLMCGLSQEKINGLGGINTNKYLAYLALCNSATDEWADFDIDKVIVVEDLITNVPSWVDYINENTYDIERKYMDISITHTDGCGMLLPKVSKKSKMVRLPWIKGLLVPFPFDKFVREQYKKTGVHHSKIKDIYGQEWDILKDGIEIILTKSQFKMHMYYSSWGEYKQAFKTFACQAGICFEEEDHFSDAKLNYQMLQTLTDLTDEELLHISNESKRNILNIGRDKDTMLKVLGVLKSNTNKNYIQQALTLYPELLNDTYSKEILKSIKKSLVKEARSGKLDINGKYTFICPDLYAFSEFLFCQNEEPAGLLKNGEVYCSLYKHVQKLDCLRSPHLYREHAVRTNRIDDDKARWFITKGLYTSIHDVISKLLMFDVDGDKALVCADQTIVEAAERNMDDIVPLFYTMTKASLRQLNNESLYEGLRAAYTGGNIGIISNNITKIWNSENVDLNVVKWLCMENNYVIDYAKTLFKITRPDALNTIITGHTKTKLPYFFIYANNKKNTEVEQKNYSVVNKLESIIPNPRINFKATNLGTFNYKLLMKDNNTHIDPLITNKYTQLDLKSRFMKVIAGSNEANYGMPPVYAEIRKQLLAVNNDIYYVVDVLIEYLYNHKKSSYKSTLWTCFGDIIVDNIKNNIDTNFIQCEICGTRILKSSSTKKYCDTCFQSHRQKYKAFKEKEYRKNRGQSLYQR